MKRRKRSASPPLTGSITVPGDKSISHRALIFAALGDGTSRLTGLNEGADVESTRACLARLGVDTHRSMEDLSQVIVEGSGWKGLGEPTEVLDAGNSGTTIRSLAGVVAAISGLSVLTGDETLRRRPMLRIVEPLRAMGAAIDGRAAGDLRSAGDPRRTADRYEARLEGCERAGEDGSPSGRPGRRGEDRGHRAGSQPRPHRADARFVGGADRRVTIAAWPSPRSRPSRRPTGKYRVTSPRPSTWWRRR